MSYWRPYYRRPYWRPWRPYYRRRYYYPPDPGCGCLILTLILFFVLIQYWYITLPVLVILAIAYYFSTQRTQETQEPQNTTATTEPPRSQTTTTQPPRSQTTTPPRSTPSQEPQQATSVRPPRVVLLSQHLRPVPALPAQEMHTPPQDPVDALVRLYFAQAKTMDKDEIAHTMWELSVKLQQLITLPLDIPLDDESRRILRETIEFARRNRHLLNPAKERYSFFDVQVIEAFRTVVHNLEVFRDARERH